MFYIYLVTNLINGKQYIGQHKGKLDDKYLGSGVLIKEAIKKYGRKNFRKTILCICSSKTGADEKEKEIIKKYNAVKDPNFYNLQEGGIGRGGWGGCEKWRKEHPEEARKMYQSNIEKAHKWWKNHPEEQEKRNKQLLEDSTRWRKEHPELVKQIMVKVNEGKIKWQKEHPLEHKAQVQRFIKSGSEANSKKVKCITTGDIFPSISAAARYFNIPQTNISKVLAGERKSAGKHPETGKKLFWELVK